MGGGFVRPQKVDHRSTEPPKAVQGPQALSTSGKGAEGPFTVVKVEPLKDCK